MKFTLCFALMAVVATSWAQDGTAKVRKVQAQAAAQGDEVKQLHTRVDTLEADSAKADAQLKAKDQAIADLERQLAAARAVGQPAAAAGAASTAHPGH